MNRSIVEITQGGRYRSRLEPVSCAGEKFVSAEGTLNIQETEQMQIAQALSLWMFRLAAG